MLWCVMMACSPIVVPFGSEPQPPSDDAWRFGAPGTSSGGASSEDSDDRVDSGGEIGDTGGAGDSAVPVEVDEDGDGHTTATDCNDTDAGIYPGAGELCDGAGIDEDCDGLVNDADPDVSREFEVFYDFDGDGFGDPATSAYVCESPSDAWIGDNTDCDDLDASANPDMVEVDGDGIDNDCDGVMTDDICVFFDTGEEADVTMFNRSLWTGSTTEVWASGASPVCDSVSGITIDQLYQFNGTSGGEYLVSMSANRITAVWVGDYLLTVGDTGGYDCVRTNDGYGVDDWCTVVFYQ